MDAFSSALSILGVVETSINTASALYSYINDVRNADVDIKGFGEEINALLSVLGNAKDLLTSQNGRFPISQELQSALDTNCSKLVSIKCQLDDDPAGKSSRRRHIWKKARWPFIRHKFESDIKELRKSRDDIALALSIDKAKLIMDIHHTQSEDILSRLPVVQGAAFDAHANEHEPECHPGTRVKILDKIDKWAQASEGRRIYWLCGMAGTGKSTICRTVAHSLADLNIPIASFFFKKGYDNRDNSNALFTTIVKQLVENLPEEMALHVQQALQDHPSISDKTLSKQFEELLQKPLQKCKSLPPVIVVVLDALDECDDQANAAKIIEILPSIEKVSSTCFKVLVSSRPECHLRRSFAQLDCKYNEIFLHEALHEVADEEVRHDISVFLESQLGRIRDRYNLTNLELPTDWPPQSLVTDLVDISVPLFILAATACRFIGDEDLGMPTTLAQEFLQHHREVGNRNPLARTYLPILEQLLVKRNGSRLENRRDDEKVKIIEEFRRVVGTIVLLEAPLSIKSLSELLQVDSRDISSRLSSLHSVLNVPKYPNSPVKLFHLSFRDFLIGTSDRDQKHDFLVNERETHANLAHQCLALLSKDGSIKQDICELGAPGKLRCDIHPSLIDTCLPPHVRYACLYWVFHLKESGGRISDDDETHRFLIKHLIHWLEALSLLGNIGGSLDMVDHLMAMVSSEGNNKVSGLLRDTKRFIRTYRNLMDIAPLQIYSSALVFAPKRSEFRQCFQESIPTWIKHQPSVPMDWDACLETLEGHDEIYQAVLSPDSSLIAARGLSMIQVWRSDNGALIYELEVDSYAIAFSPDSSSLHSVSYNGDLLTWETDTWTYKTSVEANVDVKSIVVLGRKIPKAAISRDCTLFAWALGAEIYIRAMTTPGSSINRIKIKGPRTTDLMFSPDSTCLLVGFPLRRLQIWSVHSKQLHLNLTINSHRAAAFSPDSSLLAVRTEKAIQIYAGTGSWTLRREFPLGDRPDFPGTLAFSHDATLLAIGLHFKIEIRLTETGECIQTLSAHTNTVKSLVFSHDSTFLVSASVDKTLRIWITSKRRSVQVQEKKLLDFNSIVPSPNSSLVYLRPLGSAVEAREKKLVDFNSIVLSPDSSLVLLQSRKSRQGNYIWQILRVGSSTPLEEFDGDKLQSKPTFTHDSALAMIEGGAAVTWYPDGRRHIQNLDDFDPSGIHTTCFSADLKLIAGLSRDRSLQIWQMDTGECIRCCKFAVPGDYVPNAQRFSPDASHIACALRIENYILVWQVQSDKPVQKFELPQNVSSFALSDTRLAAAIEYGICRIWSLETGHILHHLHSVHKDGNYMLAFSGDSTLLASAKQTIYNNALHIWSADTGALVKTIHVGFPIMQLSFEPDNSGLRTNLARIKFTYLADQSRSWRNDGFGFSNDGENEDGCWITFNGARLLWLPAEYRGRFDTVRAVSESVVAIVPTFSAHDAIIGFDVEELARLYNGREA